MIAVEVCMLVGDPQLERAEVCEDCGERALLPMELTLATDFGLNRAGEAWACYRCCGATVP